MVVTEDICIKKLSIFLIYTLQKSPYVPQHQKANEDREIKPHFPGLGPKSSIKSCFSLYPVFFFPPPRCPENWHHCFVRQLYLNIEVLLLLIYCGFIMLLLSFTVTATSVRTHRKYCKYFKYPQLSIKQNSMAGLELEDP